MENGKIKKESYRVEGMTCAGCERTVQRVVGNLDGIKTSMADLKNSTLTVEYDPGRVTIEQIKTAVQNVGYKFVGERPPFGQREGRDDAVS